MAIGRPVDLLHHQLGAGEGSNEDGQRVRQKEISWFTRMPSRGCNHQRAKDWTAGNQTIAPRNDAVHPLSHFPVDRNRVMR